MKILLTGASGFIGSHYYNHIKEDHEVTPVDRSSGTDLCEYHDFEDQDVVVHMAATNGTKLFYETPTEVSFNNTSVEESTENYIEKLEESSDTGSESDNSILDDLDREISQELQELQELDEIEEIEEIDLKKQ